MWYEPPLCDPEDAVTEPRQGSAARTIALLRLLAEESGPLSLSQLAEGAGLPPSSVHRLLQPLQREGMVERGEGQSYQIGREFLRLAGVALRQVELGAVARPILQDLWEATRETCAFCVYKPRLRRAHVVEIVETSNPLQFVLEPFAELSLTWGSLGRAILAFLPDAEVAAAVAAGLPSPFTGAPPPSRAEILPVLEETRRQGYAYYRSDPLDAAGVAAPVWRADGTLVGSLGVTLPASRLPPEQVPGLAERVRAAARRLSDELGHQH
jgi:DNA-binding IclR family transcriptional regulator